MNRKGFTLIELLVASSIFLLATFAFAYLLKMGMDSVSSASRLKQATCRIQSQAEEIRVLPFDTLTALDGKKFAQGKGQIGVQPVLVDLLKIELELDWNPNKIPLKITTLRSSY